MRRSAYDARMRRRIQLRLALVASLALAPAAGAVSAFNVNEPWVKPAAAGGSTEAYMEMRSSDASAIVDVRSPVAASVMLVTSKGRQAPPFALTLPAGTLVSLAAGGNRFALLRVSRPLNLGDRVPLTLVVRRGDGTTQDIDVDAEVRRHSPSYDHGVGRPHPH